MSPALLEDSSQRSSECHNAGNVRTVWQPVWNIREGWNSSRELESEQEDVRTQTQESNHDHKKRSPFSSRPGSSNRGLLAKFREIRALSTHSRSNFARGCPAQVHPKRGEKWPLMALILRPPETDSPSGRLARRRPAGPCHGDEGALEKRRGWGYLRASSGEAPMRGSEKCRPLPGLESTARCRAPFFAGPLFDQPGEDGL